MFLRNFVQILFEVVVFVVFWVTGLACGQGLYFFVTFASDDRNLHVVKHVLQVGWRFTRHRLVKILILHASLSLWLCEGLINFIFWDIGLLGAEGIRYLLHLVWVSYFATLELVDDLATFGSWNDLFNWFHIVHGFTSTSLSWLGSTGGDTLCPRRSHNLLNLFLPQFYRTWVLSQLNLLNFVPLLSTNSRNMDKPFDVQEVVSDVASEFKFFFLFVGLDELGQHVRPVLSPSQPHRINHCNSPKKRIDICLLIKRINAH